jgi:hypothetical protein
MNRKRLKVLVALGALLAWIAGTPQAAAEERKYITIATGSYGGVYYPLGSAICRLFNLGRTDSWRCIVESTNGSVYNIEAVRSGDFDFGVVQSDVQNEAYGGIAAFKDAGAFKDLRTVFSIHPEPFTVLARAESGIEHFDDLRGKRVNIGNPGSGQRATVDTLLKAYGWTLADFSETSELPPAEQNEALCGNRLDAIVFMVGHPNGLIQDATFTCAARLVTVDGPKIEAMIANHPYFIPSVIPGGTYHGNPDDVATFGVRATLVTTAAQPDNVVYDVTKAVFDNFDVFRKLHRVLETVTSQDMIADGQVAPLHDGARRYYRDNKLTE